MAEIKNKTYSTMPYKNQKLTKEEKEKMKKDLILRDKDRPTGRKLTDEEKREMILLVKDKEMKMSKGGMAKSKKYAKGGYANCGASMPPAQKSSKGNK
jgi:hypothetical protein